MHILDAFLTEVIFCFSGGTSSVDEEYECMRMLPQKSSSLGNQPGTIDFKLKIKGTNLVQFILS
jgi:hypothetical protein